MTQHSGDEQTADLLAQGSFREVVKLLVQEPLEASNLHAESILSQLGNSTTERLEKLNQCIDNLQMQLERGVADLRGDFRRESQQTGSESKAAVDRLSTQISAMMQEITELRAASDELRTEWVRDTAERAQDLTLVLADIRDRGRKVYWLAGVAAGSGLISVVVSWLV